MTLLFMMDKGRIISKTISEHFRHRSVYQMPKCWYLAREARRVIWLEGRVYLKNHDGIIDDAAWVDFNQPVAELREAWQKAEDEQLALKCALAGVRAIETIGR